MRTQNPTHQSLEECLASLEDGKHGLCFGSGLAATTTVMTLLSAGDHVVVCDDVYGGTYRLFDKVFRRYGLSFDFVDGRDVRL
ncbi:MAG: PLP-dependent transferase [Candidatus Obscuribacterales bacterium]